MLCTFFGLPLLFLLFVSVFLFFMMSQLCFIRIMCTNLIVVFFELHLLRFFHLFFSQVLFFPRFVLMFSFDKLIFFVLIFELEPTIISE